MDELSKKDKKEMVKSLGKAGGQDIIPLLVVISYIMASVVYHFFTPWYVRLWVAIKRSFKRIVG